MTSARVAQEDGGCDADRLLFGTACRVGRGGEVRAVEGAAGEGAVGDGVRARPRYRSWKGGRRARADGGLVCGVMRGVNYRGAARSRSSRVVCRARPGTAWRLWQRGVG